MEFVCRGCDHPHSNQDLMAQQNDFDPEVIEVFLDCSVCGYKRSVLVEIAEFTSEEDF